jgi:hypothetical protein
MTFDRFGGAAALVCAGTYLFGFALLVTVLAPTGAGSEAIDPAATVQFMLDKPGVLTLWYVVIYIVNAIALTGLVVALYAAIHDRAPHLAVLTLAFGLIWATLVLGAGMIANVAAERAAYLAQTDFEAATALWTTLHAVELGLGGGNEIAGGVWILLVSFAARKVERFGLAPFALGVMSGLGGLATLITPIGDAAGAVFGLGAIAWFVAAGLSLLRHKA